MYRPYLLVIVAVAALASLSFSGSVNASLGSFLKGYVGNSSASLVYSGSNFSIVDVNGSYIAVAVPYSLVTNYSRAFSYFKEYLLHNSTFNASAIENLSAKATALYNGSRQKFAECFTYTGLNATYLALNSTNGCATVGVCSSYLSNATKAPSLQLGIINLSKQYNILNNSYGGLMDAVGRVNSGNYYEYAGQIASYAKAIGEVPFNLMHNPLFSVPSNFSSSLYKNCPIFPTAGTLQSFPWYCQMLGFCQNIGFNYGNASSMISIAGTLSVIPQNSTISDDAHSAVSLASAYILQASSGNRTLFDSFLNSTNSIIGNASAISGKLSNATMRELLYRFNLTVQNVRASNYNNFVDAQRNVSAILSSIANLTSELDASYGSAYNMSLENSALLSRLELDMRGSSQLAQLQGRQDNLSSMFSNVILWSSLSGIAANLTELHGSIAALQAPSSLAAFVKSFDSWFVSPLASGTGSSLDAREGSAPAYATLLSAIIGAIVLIISYGVCYRSIRRNRHRHDYRKKARAIKVMLAILTIAVIAYIAVTYSVAEGGSYTLPFAGFLSRVNGSSTVVLAVSNTLSNSSSVIACTSALKSALSSADKNVTSITVGSQYSCLSSSIGYGDCLNLFVGEGTPVIIVNGTSATSYRGLYGFVLYANESYSSGSACMLADLFK